jgi:diaminopimelate epimerase
MSFSKWHALGNTYLLAERAELADALTPERVRETCDGRADGVLEVLSVDGDTAEIAIWNPDGSTAELSGNGTRIAARWLAERTGAREVRIRVGDREVPARMLGGADVETSLGLVEVGEIEMLDLGSELVELTPVSVGNPHAVIRREPERGELLRIGPLVENHARFPERTNVQLVRVDGLHDLSVAVWERGAGETSASGTSAVAAAAAAVANGWSESPITVHMPGGDLRVTLDAENRATLVGPAERLTSG